MILYPDMAHSRKSQVLSDMLPDYGDVGMGVTWT